MVFSKGKSCFVKNGNNARYYPQKIVRPTPRAGNIKIYGNNILHRYNSTSNYKVYNEKLPISILYFNTDENRLHPTQKPVDLLIYLIETYTKSGEVVLDNCMGSGSTGVACVQLDRDFIGIEIEEKYFKIAKERIDKTIIERKMMLW